MRQILIPESVESASVNIVSVNGYISCTRNYLNFWSKVCTRPVLDRRIAVDLRKANARSIHCADCRLAAVVLIQ